MDIDIVGRLRFPICEQRHGEDNPRLPYEETKALMREAADVIEHLRSTAGAVSRGASFTDIREQARTAPILKAFDGA